MQLDAYLEEQLAELRARDLLRDPNDHCARGDVEAAARRAGQRFLDATSNDYLGLAASRDVSRETPRAGAGASRLVQGTWNEHLELERELANWVDQPQALLFSSGFAANSGGIAALAGPGSLVLSDQLNHASIIDGCRLARAELRVIPHLDLGALETALRAEPTRPRWVLSESYFSMDGDGPDLRRLRALCDAYDAWLVVDEAHALGVYGPEGAGRCAEAGVRADVLIGTLGKSVGTQGAFVAGSATLRTFLWNRARSFVFSTGTSPVLCATTLQHVRRVRQMDPERACLLANSAYLRERFAAARLPVVDASFGPVIALVAGSAARALHLAARLRAAGILAQPIRPPTVPEGSARLRITISSDFTRADVDRLFEATLGAWGTDSQPTNS